MTSNLDANDYFGFAEEFTRTQKIDRRATSVPGISSLSELLVHPRLFLATGFNGVPEVKAEFNSIFVGNLVYGIFSQGELETILLNIGNTVLTPFYPNREFGASGLGEIKEKRQNEYKETLVTMITDIFINENRYLRTYPVEDQVSSKSVNVNKKRVDKKRVNKKIREYITHQLWMKAAEDDVSRVGLLPWEIKLKPGRYKEQFTKLISLELDNTETIQPLPHYIHFCALSQGVGITDGEMIFDINSFNLKSHTEGNLDEERRMKSYRRIHDYHTMCAVSAWKSRKDLKSKLGQYEKKAETAAAQQKQKNSDLSREIKGLTGEVSDLEGKISAYKQKIAGMEQLERENECVKMQLALVYGHHHGSPNRPSYKVEITASPGNIDLVGLSTAYVSGDAFKEFDFLPADDAALATLGFTAEPTTVYYLQTLKGKQFSLPGDSIDSVDVIFSMPQVGKVVIEETYSKKN